MHEVRADYSASKLDELRESVVSLVIIKLRKVGNFVCPVTSRNIAGQRSTWIDEGTLVEGA